MGAGKLGSGSWGVSGWQVRDTESRSLALTFLDVEQNCQPKAEPHFLSYAIGDLRECSRRSGCSSNYQGHGEGPAMGKRGRWARGCPQALLPLWITSYSGHSDFSSGRQEGEASGSDRFSSAPSASCFGILISYFISLSLSVLRVKWGFATSALLYWCKA